MNARWAPLSFGNRMETDPSPEYYDKKSRLITLAKIAMSSFVKTLICLLTIAPVALLFQHNDHQRNASDDCGSDNCDGPDR